jgi:hypothetical protein
VVRLNPIFTTRGVEDDDRAGWFAGLPKDMRIKIASFQRWIEVEEKYATKMA